MSEPQAEAGQRNARPTPHWSSGNGHLISLQAARAGSAADAGQPPPNVIGSPARATPSATSRMVGRIIPGPSTDQLHIVVLDQRIGQELVRRLLERGLGLRAVVALDLDVEDLALAHARHAIDAERLERALDRLALRVEDARLEGDGHTSLHQNSFICDMATMARTTSAGGTSPPIRSGTPDRTQLWRKMLQCTAATADCSKSRPRPATCPLSPTSRRAAQNAA